MENQLELINKYNAPVPRYTSYPPANHFTNDINGIDLKKAIIESNSGSPQNISIYIHIPFCKKLCYYCGCNACPMPKDDDVAKYIDGLKKELDIVLELLDKSRKLSQIHYGGGTPNAIPLHYLKELNDLILDKFKLIDEPEIAIECNPAYLGKDEVDELLDAGFNRFSFGIQDFDDNVLDNVNRESSKMPIDKLMTYVKEKSPETKLNLDFIYGLSGQTEDSFLNTIKKAAALKPDRLVTFSYAHVPWVNKTQKILEKKGLPEQNEKLMMYYTSKEYLVEQGYKPIGFDHYVLNDDELYRAYNSRQLHRNFQGYCTRRTTGQVYAFGVSAISQLENVYAQNTKDIPEYIESVNTGELPVIKGYKLSEKEILVREIITDILCNQFLDLKKAADDNNLTLIELKELLKLNDSDLDTFIEDEIIEYDGKIINVTEKGVLFIRNVAAALDPNYEVKENKYSRSV